MNNTVSRGNDNEGTFIDVIVHGWEALSMFYLTKYESNMAVMKIKKVGYGFKKLEGLEKILKRHSIGRNYSYKTTKFHYIDSEDVLYTILLQV